MKSLKKKRFIIVLLLLVSTIAVGSILSSLRSSAASVQNKIEDTLDRLGVTDAVSVGANHNVDERLNEYLLYTSASTGTGYFFESEYGQLVQVWDASMMGVETPENEISVMSVMGVEDLESVALEYAAACVGSDLIADLEIRQSHNAGYGYVYTVVEKYDGIETGTVVVVTCDNQGKIISCEVTIGNLFEKNEDGNITSKNGMALIEANAAKDTMYNAMTQEAGDLVAELQWEDTVCELRANGEKMYYFIRIFFKDDNGTERAFSGNVDAYTGEILVSALSK